MAKYLSRTCPRCGDYLGVVVPEPKDSTEEIPVNGCCLRCGFRLIWELFPGKRRLISLVLFLFVLVTPAGLLGEVCPNNQVPLKELKQYDSALPLPLALKIQAEVTHLPWGFPGRNRLLYHREFIISYEPDRRVPVWVAYRLRGEDLVQRQRRNSFRTDSRLNPQESATCADYEEPVFDRGHLVPNADMNRSAEAQAYTFFLSNMAPQHDRFNRGIWAYLEGIVRDWAKVRGTVYIITGGVFDRDNDGKRDPLAETVWTTASKRVGVPTHFYKIVLHAGAVLESISILLPHLDMSISNRDVYLRKHLVSITEIQRRTGLDFLPGLGPLTQDVVEKAVAQDLWPRQ